ncbi:MAG: cyclic nucleotide-binding domain-containing protein [Acidobacteriota bacterium]
MNKPVFKTGGKRPQSSYTTEFKGGEFVFREGDLGTDMYIVQEGRVEILQKARDGSEKVLATLEKGDFFGEMSVLEDLPRTASARAAGDAKLLQINGATFDQMLRGNPEIAVRMMRKLSRRLRETDRVLREALGTSGPSGVPELPTPEVAHEAAGPQRLVHKKSGMEFFLATSSESTIGRRDPVTGIHPDIDLTPVDSQRSISRRHAKIYRRSNKFFVAEEIGTMNGTFVNNVRIETGVPAEIKDGDEVRFGVIETVFHLR